MNTALYEPASDPHVVDDPQRPDEFADLFEQYVADDNLPSTEWLTRLRLQRPRRNMRCLGKTTCVLKRLTDVVVAATMLVLLAPLMLLVAIAVRITSSGPIIFQQTRVGLNLRQIFLVCEG